MRFVIRCIWLVCCIVVAGPAWAGPKLEIDFSVPRAAATTRASVQLEVRDRRPGPRGGDEPDLIGQVRGGYGNPFGVFLRSQRVETITRNWVVSALAAEGIDVGRDGPLMVVDIENFWTDGYMHNRAWIDLEFRVETRGDPWTSTLHAEDGTSIGTRKGLERAFRGAIEGSTEPMREQFRGRAFLDALNGGALFEARDTAAEQPARRVYRARPPSSARAPAERASDCDKDTDCPGDLVCRTGRCRR